MALHPVVMKFHLGLLTGERYIKVEGKRKRGIVKKRPILQNGYNGSAEKAPFARRNFS
jgi:hypothetical protein